MSARRLVVAATLAALLGASLGGAAPAAAAPGALYGVQDDSWLLHGPGSLGGRLDQLERLGVDVVRFTLRWNEVAAGRPSAPRRHTDPAYDWNVPDSVLRGLRSHGIQALVTLYGTPSWANGGRPPSYAPTSPRPFADFAHAAATRYPWVRLWSVWNEPNRAQWLRPTTAATYVSTLLNPAYREIHAAIRDARVGGGMTAPRAGNGGVSPVAWIRALGKLGARLDAYAHHPYPARPRVESPWEPACRHCSSIAMADLERLVAVVRASLGRKRIWVTEFGYQTNPPDLLLGVPFETQAEYVSSAARRVYAAPYVDILIHFLVQDDANDAGWQSGLLTTNGERKPSYAAFRFPLDVVRRKAGDMRLWGQIRPRSGRQPYRLEWQRAGDSGWLGGVRWTDARGVLSVVVRVPRGTTIRLFSVRDSAYGAPVRA